MGGKWLETKTSDIVIDGTSRTGPSRLEENGVQVDLYSLLAFGSTYAIIASSIGAGDSKLRNTSNSDWAPIRAKQI